MAPLEWATVGLASELARDPMHLATGCHSAHPAHWAHGLADPDQRNQKELLLLCPHHQESDLRQGALLLLWVMLKEFTLDCLGLTINSVRVRIDNKPWHLF